MRVVFELIEPIEKYVLMLLMLSSIFDRKWNKRVHYIGLAVYAVIAAIFCHYLSRSIEVTDSFYEFLIAMFVTAMLWGFLFLKKNYKWLVFYILTYLDCIVFSNVFSNVFSRTLALHLNKMELFDGKVMILSYFFSALLLILTNIFLSRYRVDMNAYMPKGQYGIMVVIPLVLFISNDLWRPVANMNQPRLLFVTSCLFFVLLVSYYMYSTTIREYEMERILSTSNNLLSMQINEMKKNMSLVKEMRKVRHELKNNYFHMSILLKEEKYQELSEFISKSYVEKLETVAEIKTGNRYADMILNQKVNDARNQNIPVQVKANLTEELPIEKEELCAIMFNLIDNALEASQKLDNPNITIEAKMIQSFFQLAVKNKVAVPVLESNPELQTVKNEKSNHGIGLTIVREIVKKYNGTISFEDIDGEFVVSLMI